ncbi:hypothetical protein RSAG8_05022, partial [Rhizoctonia solani AG-8 WAC10335]
MEPDESNSKRKRPEPDPTGGSLHPGAWRGSKKARSVSRSISPSPSGASTPSEVGASEFTQSNRKSRGLAKLLPRSRERTKANATSLPQPSQEVLQGPVTVNAATPAQNSTGTTRFGLEEAFRKLRIVTDTICPPLCSVIDDLTVCLHVFEAAAANNRQEYHDLTDELKSLVEQLIRHLHSAPSEDITDSISTISEAIRKEIESIGVRQSRGGVRRILDASGDDEDLRRRYRRIKQLFQQILGEASMSTWNITSEHFINTQLESMHPAKLARFDSSLSTEINRRICTGNTRTKILKESLTWSEDPNGAKIYWMNGMAGTGKTTIATTLSTALEARKQLAASFFCTRTSPECREAKRIVPTIAYQFARRCTPFRSALCKALKEDPDISSGNISSQFELLLSRPLMKVKDRLPDNLVIVVDALDECNDPHIVELFLNLLFRSIVDLPIKFYVTSRPEPAIRNRMLSESERTRSILYLHEIEKSLVQADIELYLKEELESMSPAEFDVKKLAEHAGNLFIYAATAARYIRPMGKTVNSRARLSTILAVNTESQKKLSGLDALYSAILTAAIDDQDLEPEERESILVVLWTAICACEPTLVGTLSALCGLGKSSTTNALEPLRSVLHTSDHSGLVTTLHASFPDYMLTQERSGVYFCDKAIHSEFLVERCFEIMQAPLRFNIGSIESLFIPDNGIPDFVAYVNSIISEELFYACRFWADHLSQTHATEILVHLIQGFLSERLLFWMGVLKLKGCIDAGVLSITKLIKWLLQNDSDTYLNLQELANGASRLIISYISSPASAYTPHIYLSLLPLTSPSNPLRSYHLPRFQGLVKVSGALVERLGQSTLSSWTSEIEPTCAAFSPINDLIALGSVTGEIRVQNAYNGRYHVQPYKAHMRNVQCLDISRNGMWIVSGSYGTFCVRRMQDGSLISGPFKGQIGQVTFVKFSPDGTHIVSAGGFHDFSVGIWSSNDANAPMRSFTGHIRRVNSVDFSPDGTRIVSGDGDGTIRVWDLSSGTTIFIIQSWSTVVNFVRFTPDGAHIISASYRLGAHARSLHTWDASDGSPHNPIIHIPLYRDSPIAISPEGDRIASFSSATIIDIWNRHSSKPIAGPFSCVFSRCVALSFSDDGMRLVSAFNDRTVQVWDAYDRIERVKPLSRLTWLGIDSHFTISPHRAQVAEIFESSANVWNLETAALINGIPIPRPESTQFSLDGNRALINSIPAQPYYSKFKSMQFSLDGKGKYDLYNSGEICTLKIDTAELIDGPHLCKTTRYTLDSAACLADGTRVVTCSRGAIELWDVQSHRSIAYLKLDEYDWQSHSPQVIFSQSGRRLLTNIHYASQPTLHVWDADNGTCLAGPFLVKELLDISPDGKLILCSTHTPTITTRNLLHLIDVGKGEMTFLTKMSTNYYESWTTIFSDDGLHVVSASPSQCQIWDIHNRTITTIQPAWVGNLQSFTYSPNGLCQACSTAEEEGDIVFQALRFRVDQPFCITIDSNGWLCDAESRPLLWVPTEISKIFPRGNGVRISKGESLCVDYSDMLVGDEWSKCYIGG